MVDQEKISQDFITEPMVEPARPNQIAGLYPLEDKNIRFDGTQDKILCTYEVSFHGIGEVTAPVSLHQSRIFSSVGPSQLLVNERGEYTLFLQNPADNDIVDAIEERHREGKSGVADIGVVNILLNSTVHAALEQSKENGRKERQKKDEVRKIGLYDLEVGDILYEPSSSLVTIFYHIHVKGELERVSARIHRQNLEIHENQESSSLNISGDNRVAIAITGTLADLPTKVPAERMEALRRIWPISKRD